MKKSSYRIAQFGTYDIESLGDTMFPKAFAYGMCGLPCEIELFSMQECAAPYNGNSHVYAFAQFPERQKLHPFDAVVIGGGEFLHFRKMDVIIDGVQTAYPEGYIWKKPLELAAEFGIPAYLNCVGVSYDLDAEEQRCVRDYFEKVRMISVRDVFSARRLCAAGIPAERVSCVADNLWLFNRMYPQAELTALRTELEQRTGTDFTKPYLLVQYGTTRAAEELARQLVDIRRETGLHIILMAVNYCHEDRVALQKLAALGDGQFTYLSDYLQPRELMAVIAGAQMFIGTSLHGNLTAASYGVPFIGIDMYPSFVSKMDGIFSMLGCEQYLIPREAGLKAAFRARMLDCAGMAALPEKIGAMQARLDAHFARMAQMISEEE